MTQTINLAVTPEQAADNALLRKCILKAIGTTSVNYSAHRILRRCIDARNRQIKINLQVLVYFDGEVPAGEIEPMHFMHVQPAPIVVIVGAGPAGLFAALQLLQAGIRPVIIERGKQVRERRRDLAILNRAHLVNPDSNYGFGKGGAGTYSDGTLYTRSTKSGDVVQVLRLM